MRARAQAAALLLLLMAANAGAGDVVVSWIYRGTGTNPVSFNVRMCVTNRVVAPSYDWPIVTNTPNSSVRLPINERAACVWFAVSTTNQFGESIFALTPR